MALAQQRLGSLQGRRAAALNPTVSVSRRFSAPKSRRQVAVQARLLPQWPDVYSFLKGKDMKTIPPEAASELVNSGDYVLIDVRLPTDHEKAHPEGSIAVPMYVNITNENMDAAKMMKMIAYRFNGVNPVEPNPAFFDQVRAAAKGKKGVVVFCEAGGTLVPTVNFPAGKASRSLQAAYRILNEGITEVLHLERGAYGWYQAGLPFVGDYAPELGRTPLAAAEPTLQRINQSVGYEQRAGDTQAVPEQKKKTWPW